MESEQQLAQLKEMLASEIHGKRHAGVAMAAQMLVGDLHRLEVRALLEQVAKSDLLTTIREDARQALAGDDARHSPPQTPDYVFGAKCNNCHTIKYLNKREVCNKQADIEREIVVRDGQVLNAIWVTCEHCGGKFKAYVPCEGYQ